ncbi:uncharacterized protein BYT42DRAFT_585360 [Radiomyces spectabilis]|uniref:uncharacterized protein n=1 Tax=Radiomyces spectabilis TaxID=64574 RepID=UPI0022206E1D|nr:uncharacterized protein BYT42DRAFT_585360 [Radiomyces spectabilis]KAI8368126.1 hypothetical protein BYT42DRAFT_585360 [Radiomyces spectabilis]
METENEIYSLDTVAAKLHNGSPLDQGIIEYITSLMREACVRTMTIPEGQVLVKAFQYDGFVEKCGLSPDECLFPSFLEFNHFIALDIVPILIKTSDRKEFLYALAEVPVTPNSVDVIHHVLTCGSLSEIPSEFLHAYVSKCIRSCELLDEGVAQDRQVKLVTKLVQSLLQKQLMPIAEYFIEIQSFCVANLRFKVVANLFRVASAEAQRIGYDIQ